MENKTGIIPVEYKVLILPDEVDGETKGGLIIPISVVEKKGYEVVRATIVARGGSAFFDDTWGPKEREKLVPGTRVLTKKYAGVMMTHDRVKYRLCNDKDIIAILEEKDE